MHSDYGIFLCYKGPGTLYRNPVIKTTSDGLKSVQTSNFDHGNRLNLQNLVFIRIQEGGHCPEYSHNHSGIKKKTVTTHLLHSTASFNKNKYSNNNNTNNNSLSSSTACFCILWMKWVQVTSDWT